MKGGSWSYRPTPMSSTKRSRLLLWRPPSPLADKLEESGEAWVSTTKLRGRTFLRAGVVNYLSSPADVDRMIAALVRLAERA